MRTQCEASPLVELRDEVARLLGQAFGERFELLEAQDGQFVAIDALTVALLRSADDAPDDREALLRLAVAAEDMFLKVHEQRASQHSQLNQQVREGLSRLRAMNSTAELLDNVCAEVVRSCGVRRALLSRIEDGNWLPCNAHFDGDPQLHRAFAGMLHETRIDLETAPIERAVAATHAPQLVHDTSADHAYGPIIGPSSSQSYVVVPITSAGRVIGLIHADKHPDVRPVSNVDRDVVWAFADGFARIYERTELTERLAWQRRQVQATFEYLESVTTTIDRDDISLARVRSTRQNSTILDAGPVEADAAIGSLLTERERQVFAELVRGRSNRAIAERLVIREGTVKNHVKCILRKLGAVNRAELIALSVGRAAGTAMLTRR